MIGDVARRDAGLYSQMLDRQTAAHLVEFHNATSSYRWPLVDMLGVADAAGFYFRVLAELAEEQVKRFQDLSPMNHIAFIQELTRLSKDLASHGQRAVVLVDESEKLLELEGSAHVLSSLKAVIQQCPVIDFVFAGDIKPHQATSEFANLKGTLRSIHLAPLDPLDAKALIQIPVQGQLLFEDLALQRILELTGGKPCLIQILCDHLYEAVTLRSVGEIHITLAEFDRLWDAELRAKVFESLEAPLRDFFEGLQGDERSIFRFLAHHPLATVNDTAQALGIHSTSVQGGLHRLCTMHRVEEVGTGFRIRAKLVEEFGARFFTYPIVENLTANDSPPPEIKSLQDIIAHDESATLEFKSSLRWDYHRNIPHKDPEDAVIKTLAAFLNTDGGTLIIGVDDAGQVLGLNNDYNTFRKKNRDGFELHLMTLISGNLGKGTCTYIHLTFHSITQHDVCKVEVKPCPVPIYAGEEAIFYIRTGNQTQKLNPRETTEYIKHHWSKS